MNFWQKIVQFAGQMRIWIEGHEALSIVVITFSGVVISVIGWYVVARTNYKNSKREIKMQAKYEAFKSFAEKEKEFEQALIDFTSMLPWIPFSLIELELRTPDIIRKKHERDWKAGEKWAEYRNELNQKSQIFIQATLAYFRQYELWKPIIDRDLTKAYKFLMDEFQELKVQDYNMHLINHDVRKYESWDKEDMEAKAHEIMDKIQDFFNHAQDMFLLIINGLLDKVFGYPIEIRKTLSEKFKVLSENGLIVSLSEDEEAYAKYNFPIPERVKNKNVLRKVASFIKSIFIK